MNPYNEFKPGDIITAEAANSAQVKIKEDIAQQVAAAKKQITEGSVAKSGDSDKFAGKSDIEWTSALDMRYASVDHSHEGQSVYRRYIKRFTNEVNKVFLEHKLGRYPIVDVYQLLAVADQYTGDDADTYKKHKILVFYGHNDADAFKLRQEVYRDKRLYGYPLEHMLRELGVKYQNDDNLEDVLNDMDSDFMRDPNDEIDHGRTPWIQNECNKRRTIAHLKETDQWDDLHVAIKPKKCYDIANLPITESDDTLKVTVELIQVNYNTLYVQTTPETEQPYVLDLMFILRI